MIRINIKPLSVNNAWKGKRFRTDEYKAYQKTLAYLLPKINIPETPFEVVYKFGFSSALSDWDNPIKPTQDILASHYDFNDKHIKKATVTTEQVSKGKEYFEFEIMHFTTNN
jgi:hypothetical protein